MVSLARIYKQENPWKDAPDVYPIPPPPRYRGLRKVWYNKYLESDIWKKKRWEVMKRANYACEVCGDRPARHVHHLCYDYVGREPLSHLQAICLHCHADEHPDKAEEWLADEYL